MKTDPKTLLRLSGEFMVIVVGVLVALAVDRWTQVRDEQGLEAIYLDRLRVELESSVPDLQIDYYDGVEAHARAALPFVSGEEEVADSTGLVIAAYHAHRMLAPRARTGTYQELVATGNLRVIQDLDLQRKLADYYGEVAFWSQIFSDTWQDSEFNTFVRGRIPPDRQFQIADDCDLRLANPFECSTAFDGWDYSDLIRDLRADPTVARALTRRIRDVMRIRQVQGELLELIEALLEHSALVGPDRAS